MLSLPHIIQTVQAAFFPFFMFSLFVGFGLYGASVEQLRSFSVSSLLSPSKWLSLFWSCAFARVLDMGDKQKADEKRPVIAEARGRVLEVGAGTGQTLKYYDVKKVDAVLGVEPYEGAHQQLRENIVKAGLKDKYEIVPFGIDDVDKLEAYGITEGSFDTVLLVQVLCSVPNPQPLLPRLQKLLRPGGQLIIFEHVLSPHPIGRLIQHLWNFVWPVVFGGCQLTRPTGEWIEKLGGWKEVELRRGQSDPDIAVIPTCVGRFVKA